MKLKVDYLNKEKETRHIITDEENVGWELVAIIKQGATNICVYQIIT